MRDKAKDNQGTVENELTRLLFRQSPKALIGAALLWLAVIATLYGKVQNSYLLGWSALVLTLTVLFLLNYLVFLHRESTLQDLRAHRRRYTWLSIVNGIGWGLLWPLASTSLNSAYENLAFYVLALMSTAAIAVSGIVPRIYLAFILSLMAPIVAVAVLQGYSAYLDMTIKLMLAFAAVLIYSSHYFARTVRDSLALAQHNRDLVADLTSSTTALQVTNRVLQTEIDERLKVEDDLRAAQQDAESASRVKSAFLANMSHEIRTPLNGIIGFSELMGKSELSATQREYNRNILISATTLMQVVNDVLDLSKIEADKLDLNYRQNNILDLVDEVVTITAPQAYEKGLDLIRTYAEGLPRELLMDSTRIKQILFNLVTNAIKFTNRGHVLLHLGYNRAERALELQIEDTGIGIDVKDLPKLFQPFTQLERFETKRRKGTGLGLAITSNLVALMGGVIDVNSVPGTGTVFKLSIPAEPVVAETGAVKPGLQVLLVDERKVEQLSLKSMLGVLGHQVKTVATLDEYERATHLQDYDLVVLDLQQSNDMVEHWLKRSRSQRRVVLVPALDIPAELQHLLVSPSVLVITKSISLSGLAGRLAQLCGPQPPGSADQEQATNAAFDGITTLVVDDNDINRKVISTFLNILGAATTEAQNGIEALQQAERHSYDIILMDIQMPDMSGIEVVDTIRRQSRVNQNTPIVAVTAHASSEEQRQYLGQGFNDVLIKPVDEAALAAMLRRQVTRPGAAL